MLEFLRSIRLGGLSVFGVTLPGLLLLGLATTGLLIPMFVIAFPIAGGDLSDVPEFLDGNRALVLLIALLIAYTLGYILRLSSPDRLDAISGKEVLESMSAQEQKVWPYTGCPGDKFPYFQTREYLQSRNLSDVAESVKWGRDATCEDEECRIHGGHSVPTGERMETTEQLGRTRRTKTAINRIKIQLAIANPGLAATAESHEAHVRLMYGAWLSIKWTFPLLVVGILMVGAALATGLVIASGSPVADSVEARVVANAPVYAALLVLNTFLLLGCHWVSRCIQRAFHYRRVGELMYVLLAWATCCSSGGKEEPSTCRNASE